MNQRSQSVIDAARTARDAHWAQGDDEGRGDRMAITVTQNWQEQIGKLTDISTEVPVYDTAQSRIDVVDAKTKTAFELKVTQNNPHHEIYKDIAKVLVYNESNPSKKLKRLVFITGNDAARRLQRGFHAKAIEVMRKNLALAIDIVGI